MVPKGPETAKVKRDTLVVRSDHERAGLGLKRYGIYSYFGYVMSVPKRAAMHLRTSRGGIKVDHVLNSVHAAILLIRLARSGIS